jgi:hypothetical protein
MKIVQFSIQTGFIRIFEDSRQVIWVGTGNGLHSFQGGSMVSYYHDPSDNESIPSNQANDILECREGYIWIATANGLSRFNPETGKFRNYFKDPGMGRFSLSNNELTCLHEDSAGNLWVGSIAGLTVFFTIPGHSLFFQKWKDCPTTLFIQYLKIITAIYGLAPIAAFPGLIRPASRYQIMMLPMDYRVMNSIWEQAIKAHQANYFLAELTDSPHFSRIQLKGMSSYLRL